MQNYQAELATMVTSTKSVTKKGTGSGAKFPGPNGKKPGGNGWHGDDGSRRKFSPARYRITMWVVLAAIIMMFAALSSVYIMSVHGEQRVAMPHMFFASTGIILLSSWTLSKAKRSLQLEQSRRYVNWLLVTLALGLGFLSSQLIGWKELKDAGVYFVGQPHSSFFYFFTAVHGAHLLGGIFLLVFLLIRSRANVLQPETEKRNAWAAVVALYWHAMGAIWVWLFLLLLILK
jgi:cytochrome c oxidase subunit 3